MNANFKQFLHVLSFRKVHYCNLYLNTHSFSNNHLKTRKSFNPFKKKFFGTPAIDYDKKISSRIVVTVLGNGAIGQPRCLGLFTDNKAFLFNCGEGVGRFCREYDVNICLIKHIFITQRNWENLSGLHDIYISNNVSGVSKMSIYGPPNMSVFLSMVSSTRQELPLVQKSSYDDENISIQPIEINNQPTITHGIKDVAFSYACKVSKNVGEFNPEKCVKLGVPIGPHLLKLKNGEDAVLPSGRIVYAADVLDSSQPPMTFLIVDCPSEDFLNSFTEDESLAGYQLPADGASEVVHVYHFSPPHVVQMRKYQVWMNKFHQDTQHFILNASNSGMGSESVFQTQNILNVIHPEIFRLLPEDKFDVEASNCSNIIQSPPMLQVQIRPAKTVRWDNVLHKNSGTDWIEMLKEIPDFIDKLEELKSFNSLQNEKGKDFPEVLFLGTSSAASTAFRNVTGILVKLDEQNSILLDCGEGTFMQMVRYFGKSDVQKELRNISTIFISHMHTDHYMGLFSLITARIEAFKSCGFPYQTVALILPNPMVNTFYNFCELFEPLRSKVKLFLCKHLVSTGDSQNRLNNILRDAQLVTVPVKHCPEAYGVILENKNWKIVYSGDSAPCQKLIDAGLNCSLLIHEASIEDNFLSEATLKKHSTPSQVLDIAEQMNAEYVIMTHFSRRYLAVPVFQDKGGESNFGIAFDFMKVRLTDLPLLPKFVPLLKCLFQEQLNEHLAKSSNTAQFENVFLKTFRENRYR